MTRRTFYSRKQQQATVMSCRKRAQQKKNIQKMPMKREATKKSPEYISNNEIKTNKRIFMTYRNIYVCIWPTAQLINWFFIRLWTRTSTKSSLAFFSLLHAHKNLTLLAPLNTCAYIYFFLQQNIIYARSPYTLAEASKKNQARKWQTVFTTAFHSLTIPSDENFKIDFKKFLLLATRKTFYIPWDLRYTTMMLQKKAMKWILHSLKMSWLKIPLFKLEKGLNLIFKIFK